MGSDGVTTTDARRVRRRRVSGAAVACAGLLLAVSGCSLTANTSSTSKTTLGPVLGKSTTTVFRTVPFSPTTAPTTVAPAAQGAAGAPAGQLGPDGTYEVQSGDTLSGIANKLGIPYADLVAANPQIDPKKFLIVGQKLTIPQNVTVPDTPTASSTPVVSAGTPTTVNQNGAQASGQTYTVVAGDYLLGIAKKLGVPLDSLLSVNNLTTTSLITPGMKLKVPVGGKVPKATGTTTTTKKP